MSKSFVWKSVGAKRLMKEFMEMQKKQFTEPDPPYLVELVNDNVYEWNVSLYCIDQDSELAQDLLEKEIPHIQLSLIFPDNFPFSPPFMRVVEPVISGGYVFDGGSICMELLTPQGWKATYTVESILMSFAASVVKGNGRLDADQSKLKGYSLKAAKSVFQTIVMNHELSGWKTPPKWEG